MPLSLTDDDVRAAYYCTAELLRTRRLGSLPVPPAVRRLHDRLELELRSVVTRSRQEFGSGGEQLNADGQIGTAEAAELLGWSKSTVLRRANDLDGENVGGRWIFHRSTVAEYAEEVGQQCTT
jgi:excisionase family DNA binding protein